MKTKTEIKENAEAFVKLIMTEVKRLRLERNISARKLSKLIGKSPSCISNAENGYYVFH